MSNIQGQPATSVPSARVSGNPNFLVERLGEGPVSQWLPRYTALAWSGYAYSVSLTAAAAITAYTGGAAGQPQIAVSNPAGSGKNLWPVIVNYGNTVAASAAGTVSWNLFFGPTVAITAATNATPLNLLTQLAAVLFPQQPSLLQHNATPLNLLTQLAAGSVAKAWTNTALTASTALTNAIPVGSYYWATAAGAILSTPPVPMELPGYLPIPPGSMMALGGSSALTSATWTGFLAWIELPV